MMNISLEEAVIGSDGELFGENKSPLISGISIDSRTIKNSELYVSLIGERFDGHNYIKSALENGASCVMAAIDMKDIVLKVTGNSPVIFVEDTLTGFAKLAAWYRNKFEIKLVAVTGSSGKTTTKDMISEVLSRGMVTHKTEGNFNNLVGLPLTVFGIENRHEAVVLEMGMDRLGEIRVLTNIGKPDIAVITNIGTAHMENLGSRANIFKAKTEIFEGLKPSGIAVINGDDDFLKNFSSETFTVLKYGFSECCDYRCLEICNNSDGSQVFTMKGPDLELKLKLTFPGRHNVLNAMAAAICGILLKIGNKEIFDGILNFKPSKLRMEFFDGINCARVMNDSYNANPESMKAALEVMKEVSGKRKFAVLGDMLELGIDQEIAHRDIIRYIKENKSANTILTFGDAFGKAGDHWNDSVEGSKALKENFRVIKFEKKEEIIDWLVQILGKDDLVLVKGSRGMKMEQVADGLR